MRQITSHNTELYVGFMATVILLWLLWIILTHYSYIIRQQNYTVINTKLVEFVFLNKIKIFINQRKIVQVLILPPGDVWNGWVGRDPGLRRGPNIPGGWGAKPGDCCMDCNFIWCCCWRKYWCCRDWSNCRCWGFSVLCNNIKYLCATYSTECHRKMK